MNKLVLGLATMNAGYDMPGSSITTLLQNTTCFDQVIAVDGKLNSLGISLYNKYNIHYISNPWKGSLKEQYDILLTHLNEGDWWVMLDDDELPSYGLLKFLDLARKAIAIGKHPLSVITNQNVDNVKSISTPRLTCFTEDGIHFFPGEEIPHTGFTVNVAGPRAHIFKVDKSMKMMASRAGRHVVPYYAEPDSSVLLDLQGIFHYHLKAPELYVYNDCVKPILDDDIKDSKIRQEYRDMLYRNNIFNAEQFYIKTVTKKVNQEFIDFCYKYRTHGAPEGRLFIWYFNILHPELNQVPEQNWTASLKLVLNYNWRYTYLQNKKRNNFIKANQPLSYIKAKGEITL